MDDGWDPTEPNLSEMVGDWGTWAQCVTFEQGVERIAYRLLEMGSSMPERFVISPSAFMTGPHKMEFWLDKTVYRDLGSMRDALNRKKNQGGGWVGPTDLRLDNEGLTRGEYYDARLLYPAPGYSEHGLPRLDIQGTEAFVALDSDKHYDRTFFLTTLFTCHRVTEDEEICPVCDKEYRRQVDMNRSSGSMYLKEKEASRYFSSPLHSGNKNYCPVVHGSMVIDQEMKFKLHSDRGHRLNDPEMAYAMLREWCASTPGLVLVPSSYHGYYSTGSFGGHIDGERLAWFLGRNWIGQISDAEVVERIVNDPYLEKESKYVRQKIESHTSAGTVTRWRKLTGIPTPKRPTRAASAKKTSKAKG